MPRAFDEAKTALSAAHRFGGDGIFLAALTGPGRIWLQTLPLANLAHALQPYLSTGGNEVRNVGTAAVLGGIVGSMFENR